MTGPAGSRNVNASCRTPQDGARQKGSSLNTACLLLLMLICWVDDVESALNKNANNQTANSSMSETKQKLSPMFVGYANNPFGPSKKVLHKIKYNSTMKENLSTLSDQVSANNSENEVDTDLDESRAKRGVFHLYNMVACATGCNPLSYKGYGCFCGFLGSGYPVDGIDRCCKMHDWCYVSANCPMYLEYFIPYYWKCFRRKPLCAFDHGEWGGTGSCAQRLCECDRALSECLSDYPCPKQRAVCRSSPWRFLQNVLML